MTAVDPSPVTAWPTRPTLRTRITAWLTGQPARPAGRHRAGTVREVTPDHNPLHPADRVALAPTHWADRWLPAPVDELTGRMDTTAVRDQAAPPEWPGPAGTGQVLADLRAALTSPNDPGAVQA
ncbi:hypothetical protein ACN267_31210 [Micromonospora sp. WMMD734]|uniref:hypothetical protein n=1 Tax=Micromonospora sp. WMMD734 TaxID=3404129 RepID=UPI003B96621B